MAAKKKPEERKAEILNVAEKIFAQKGYEETSVEDILKVLNLSKGGFYYHFESKEAVLDAIIERYTTQIESSAKAVVENDEWNATTKMMMLLSAIQVRTQESEELLEQLHKPDNWTMHMKSLLESCRSIAPLFGMVARQGITSGEFQMKYPEEIMEALFMTATIWFDEAFFELTKEERKRKEAAFIEMAEKCTGVKPGVFQLTREL